MLEMTIIRHGETAYNQDRRFTGKTDIGLNDRGRMQALRLKERLQHQQFDRVYSSNLLRCVETAQLIDFRTEIEYTADLREINFGKIEGLTYDEFKKQYPGLARKWSKNDPSCYFPQGDRISIMQKRVIQTFTRIAAENTEKKIAVVTHGGCIWTVFAHFIARSRKGFFHLELPNGALLHVKINNDFWLLSRHEPRQE